MPSRKRRLFQPAEVVSQSWIFYGTAEPPALTHAGEQRTEAHTHCPHADRRWARTRALPGRAEEFTHSHTRWASVVNCAGLKGRGSGVGGDGRPGVLLQLSAASAELALMKTHRSRLSSLLISPLHSLRALPGSCTCTSWRWRDTLHILLVPHFCSLFLSLHVSFACFLLACS